MVILMSLFLACGEKSTDTADDTTTEDTATTTEDTATATCDIPVGTENANPSDLEGRADCGADIYASHCAACHGANGEGGSGPRLEGRIANESDASLQYVIINGEGPMPPQNLESQEVADVISFMRATF